MVVDVGVVPYSLSLIILGSSRTEIASGTCKGRHHDRDLTRVQMLPTIPLCIQVSRILDPGSVREEPYVIGVPELRAEHADAR